MGVENLDHPGEVYRPHQSIDITVPDVVTEHQQSPLYVGGEGQRFYQMPGEKVTGVGDLHSNVLEVVEPVVHLDGDDDGGVGDLPE